MFFFQIACSRNGCGSAIWNELFIVSLSSLATHILTARNVSSHQEKGAPQVSCRRRQAGFQKCIPTEMSFNSTSTLPTVFDVRHMGLLTERCQMEALISPVKFQRTVLGNEIERDPLTFENVDRQSKNTFFKHFSVRFCSLLCPNI